MIWDFKSIEVTGISTHPTSRIRGSTEVTNLLSKFQLIIS